MVGWDGYEAIYEEQCRYENWEWGGGDYDPDPGYGGGSGGGGTAPVAHYIAIDNPVNPHAATCESTKDGRYDHAAADAGAYSAWRSLHGESMLRKDDVLTITYDDGGTEKWEVLSAMTFGIIKTEPVPGTLECP